MKACDLNFCFVLRIILKQIRNISIERHMKLKEMYLYSQVLEEGGTAYPGGPNPQSGSSQAACWERGPNDLGIAAFIGS